MSAIGANGDGFTATISSNIPGPTHNILVGIWYKKNANNPGTSDFLTDLLPASEASQLRLLVVNSSGYKVSSSFCWRATSGAAATTTVATALTQDAWRLAACYAPLDVAATLGTFAYDETVTASGSFASPFTATQGLTSLALGNGGAWNVYTFFNGKYAEAFCFLVTGTTQRDSMLAQLQTYSPAVVAANNPTATLVYHYPLLADSTTGVTGPALTNVSSTAFDSGDHPTLSSTAAGVANLMGGKLLRGILVGGGLY